jgi:hypothetical protein
MCVRDHALRAHSDASQNPYQLAMKLIFSRATIRPAAATGAVALLVATRERSMRSGPFAGTKELIAGYWMWQVKSKEEAIAWVKRCPNPFETDSEIEIRQVFEAPELTQNEEIVRKKAELRAKSAKLAKH